MPTLLDWLLENYPTAKRQTFKRMLQSKRIRIDGRPAKNLKQTVDENSKVVVASFDREVGLPTSNLAIVHEDADVLVINKPAGLLTSTVPREKRPTAWAAVQNYLLESDPRSRPGLIHRLDQDASGLLIFSKNQVAYRSLKTQFFHHTVTRVYRAIAHGRVHPPAGTIDSFLVERADGIMHSARRGQRAITEYQTISSTKKMTSLRVSLLTGRKHQIRVHLFERGHPIVGDRLYCKEPAATALMLMAVELQFDHPRSGKRMAFMLDVPVEWKR